MLGTNLSTFSFFLSLEIPRLIIWIPHQGSVPFQMNFAGLTEIETDTTRSCRRFQREAIVHIPVWSLTIDMYWSSDERFAHPEKESHHRGTLKCTFQPQDPLLRIRTIENKRATTQKLGVPVHLSAQKKKNDADVKHQIESRQKHEDKEIDSF
jgi:hypothetical protein